MQLPITEKADMTDGQCRFASEMMFAGRRGAPQRSRPADDRMPSVEDLAGLARIASPLPVVVVDQQIMAAAATAPG
jgi:hypothetical protein